MVRPVNGQKFSFGVNHTQKFCKGYNTPAAVAAHAAGLAVGIIINHLKIKALLVLQKHHTIAADAKTAVAKAGNQLRIVMIYYIFAVIHQYKIVTGTLVFIKS
jgi:hypothetical protein